MRNIISTALAFLLFASPAYADYSGPPIGGGTSYTAGSGLTLTGTVFSLGDANLTYSSGALATTSLALGGATIGTNKLAVTGTAAISSDLTANSLSTSGNASGVGGVNVTTSGTPGVVLQSAATPAQNSAGVFIHKNAGLTWTNGTAGGTPDTGFARDAAGVISDRFSTSAQALRVGGSFTDASNYSWASIVAEQTGGSEACAANTFCLGTWHVGTPGGGGNMTKFGLYVDGTLRADYGVSTSSTWTFSGAGSFSSMLMTAAAPTVAAAQIGYGSTTAAAANCNVTSPAPTGCVVINVAGTTRYLPYY